MKRTFYLIVVCLIALTILGGCHFKSMSGTDIIESIIHADDTGTSYYLETRHEGPADETFTTKEWRFADGRFRMEVYDQDELQYATFYNENEYVTIDYIERQIITYDGANPAEIMSQSPRDSMIQLLQSMYDYYDIEVEDETELLGRSVFVLELTSKKGTKDNMKIWVDKENWIMLKTWMEFEEEWMVSEPIQFELNPSVNNDLFDLQNHEQFETVSMEDLL
ncbi:hypothetical protein GN156_00460 [bacterium LRH843]|nr:hypothetical protein [bacterium LRH843]